MFLKICGLTRAADAADAVAAGATALGFVFWSRSPRAIRPDAAREIVAGVPPGVLTVGVFVNEGLDEVRRIVEVVGLGAVQLHGEERPLFAAGVETPIVRAMTLESADETCRIWPPHVTLLLDAADPVRRGGTGTIVDWTRAADIARRRNVVLAGGLTPENVGEAVARVRPYGVDVSSGVERAPGEKDAAKVAAFLANARAAFARR